MPSSRRSSSPSSSRSNNHPSSSSTSTTTSHHSPPMSDEDEAVPSATSPAPAPASPLPRSSNELLVLSAPPPATRANPFPMREDCWSEDATHTLVQAWGSHYVELNRGSLRQQHWQEVAEAVNALHAHTKKLHRSDIQCKNRIDTLKKKYKVEKYKSLQSNGRYVSSWPFFDSLDSLIGDNFIEKAKPLSPSPPITRRSNVKNVVSPEPVPLKREFPSLPPPPSAVPVGPRSKRPAPAGFGVEPVFGRKVSAMTAAAAAAARFGVLDDDEEDSDMSSPEARERPRTRAGARTCGNGKRQKTTVSGHLPELGHRKLAHAIAGFAEIYERVEEAKHRQLVELEKQKMQFAKDLELQRMKLFMESQVQLEKLRRTRRNSQSVGMSTESSFALKLSVDRILKFLPYTNYILDK